MHMMQAVMTAPGKIEFREAEVPIPGRGQVQIRIQRIGICGSDIHVFHGKHPFVNYPVLLKNSNLLISKDLCKMKFYL